MPARGRGAGARRRAIRAAPAAAVVKSSGDALTARIHARQQPGARGVPQRNLDDGSELSPARPTRTPPRASDALSASPCHARVAITARTQGALCGTPFRAARRGIIGGRRGAVLGVRAAWRRVVLFPAAGAAPRRGLPGAGTEGNPVAPGVLPAHDVSLSGRDGHRALQGDVPWCRSRRFSFGYTWLCCGRVREPVYRSGA